MKSRTLWTSEFSVEKVEAWNGSWIWWNIPWIPQEKFLQGKNFSILSFFSDIIASGKLHINFKRTKSIALLKSDKQAKKLLNESRTWEAFSKPHLVVIDKVILREQAGFWPSRCDCDTDNIVALASYLESRFQKSWKRLSQSSLLEDLWPLIWNAKRPTYQRSYQWDASKRSWIQASHKGRWLFNLYIHDLPHLLLLLYI